MTEKYCVMGNPIAHSRSPWIHARFAELTGEAIRYDRQHVAIDAFTKTVKEFAATGGSEVLHKGRKAVERDPCALIAQWLACQFGKTGVNPGGAAMGNGVACNAVRVGGGGHESRGCRSSRW